MSLTKPKRPPRRQVRGIGANGVIACRRCHGDGVITPVHPSHPRSPFCEEHYEQNRKDARRKWRERQQEMARVRRAADSPTAGVQRTPRGSLVLSPESATALEAALVHWRAALDEAGETIRLASEALPPGSRKMLVRAVGHLDEQVGGDLTSWIGAISALKDRP